jgi:hypothetical protein
MFYEAIPLAMIFGPEIAPYTGRFDICLLD